MIEQKLNEYAILVEQKLTEYIQPACSLGYEKVFEAARYSAMAGGKRIRPVLVLEFCRICGGDIETALPFACALEMIHTYSLIHDDLPCMDNDDLRRGKPTNHKVYGEAMAVLAGDGLLNLAFETASQPQPKLPPEVQLAAIYALATASGMNGMIGGQVLDLEAENHHISLSELQTLQSLKTGALLKVAASLGCITAQATVEQRKAAETYAQKIGLAFQIRDDMLDIVGDADVFGKPIGSDAENGKSTYPSLLGMEACRKRIEELTTEAIQALSCFADCTFLTELAQLLAGRMK